MTARLNRKSLPKDWVWATISDIGSVKSGQTPNGISEATGEGDIPWYRVSDMNTSGNEVFLHNSQILLTQEETKALRLNIQPAGTIVFPKRGGAIRTNKKRILSKPSAYDLNTMGVIPRLTTVMYLWYWFMTVDLGSLADGSNVPQINHSDIEPLQLPLAPLNEQHRIVAAIETQFTRLDAAVTALKRSQANLKRYRAAVLKAACEGRLVPTEAELAQAEGRSYEPAAVLLERILAERRRKWEAENPKKKYQEPVALDTSELPALPEGWCWATIDQATVNLDHMRVPVNKEERAERSGDIPYYGANGPVGWIDDYIFDEPLILVVEDETFTGREKPFCYKISGKSWVNNHAHVLQAKAVTTEYLNYSLSYYPFIPLTTGTTGRRKLTKNALLNASYAVPPMAEQHRIVSEVERRLSLIDQLEKTIKADLARANRLRQSILQRAFAGQLVPQDPNDEPASVLLARIRQP